MGDANIFGRDRGKGDSGKGGIEGYKEGRGANIFTKLSKPYLPCNREII